MSSKPTQFVYPGASLLGRAVNMAGVTCILLGSVATIVLNMLFLPLSQLTGKTMASEYPVLLPWFIGSFALLGFVPGRLLKKSLLGASVEAWTRPSNRRADISLPLEQVVTNLNAFWFLALPTVVYAHHRLVGSFEGAYLTRFWLKILLALFLVPIASELVLARLKYELWRPGAGPPGGTG